MCHLRNKRERERYGYTDVNGCYFSDNVIFDFISPSAASGP